MNHEQAGVIALQALAHIAGDPGLLRRFMLETGVDPASLAQEAERPAFLAGVLDFLLRDEASLLAFCQATELPPDAPGKARHMLSGICLGVDE